MRRVTDPCCDKCTHSKESPCKDFVTCMQEGPLCHEDAECREKRLKLRKSRVYNIVEKPKIIIGMGTCGIAAGGKEIEIKLKEVLKEKNIDADIEHTGCIGMCFNEPLLDIVNPGEPRVTYIKVHPEMIEKIVVEGIEKKKVINEWAAAKLTFPYFEKDKELKDEVELPDIDYKTYDDIPYYAKQKRIVLNNVGLIDPESIDDYILFDGYKGLEKCLNDIKEPLKVIDIIKESGLRGRGGGGFPAGLKWELCQKAKGEKKYIICNADEGDPGAFMDRSALEGDPHSILEGMAIAAFAVGADEGYIYCRAEYPLAIKRLNIAIQQAEENGLLGNNVLNSGFNFKVHVKEGAGAFVCGEETALIGSIEGKRGMPKFRPPFPAQSGLWKKPTNNNNVETYGNVPKIIRKGADWFSSIGTEKSKGTKVFALTGKLRNSGLVEVPMGITLREIIYEIGGGIENDIKFKAAQTGGPSGGCIPEEHLDLKIDYDSLISVGTMMGSGGMVVMDENTCMVDVARFFLTFTQLESCGKCTFCRIGTRRMLDILEDITAGNGKDGDIELLLDLSEKIKKSSLCGLGQTAPNPVLSTLRYFENEYKEHIYEKKCRAKVCTDLLTFTIDPEKCIGCTACARKCPVNVISGEVKKVHKIDQEGCIKCGSCFEACKFDAVIVE